MTLQLAYAEATMDASIKQIDEAVKRIALVTRVGLDLEKSKEQILLSASGGATIADQLKIPEIQMEIDRAVWQVKRAIKAQQEREIKERNERDDSTHEKSDQRR